MNKDDKSLESIIGMQALEEIIPPREIVLDPNESDFEFARTNIKITIEKGNDALAELLEIATQSGHPHAYEVLSMHMKNLVEANRQLLETKRADQQIQMTKVKQGQPDVVNQNLFVGTTQQLQDLLKGKIKPTE